MFDEDKLIIRIPNTYSKDIDPNIIAKVHNYYINTHWLTNVRYVDDVRLHQVLVNPFTRPKLPSGLDLVICSTTPLAALWLYEVLCYAVDIDVNSLYIAMFCDDATKEEDCYTELKKTINAQHQIAKDFESFQFIMNKFFWKNSDAYVSNRVIDIFRRMTINVFDADGNVIA